MQSIRGLLLRGMQINSAVAAAPPPPGSPLYGEVSGYNTAGGNNSRNPTTSNVIEKFPFASDSNSTDVGDIGASLTGMSGQSSSTHGYAFAGFNTPPFSPMTPPAFQPGDKRLEKFPFASDANSTLVATHGPAVSTVASKHAASMSSPTDGYDVGSSQGLTPWIKGVRTFPFASETTFTSTPNLTTRGVTQGGISSTTDGYTVGGSTPGTPPGPTNVIANVIDKFPFASGGASTDVGDLTTVRQFIAGVSSASYGYSAGGQGPPSPSITGGSNVIDKFPFASGGNATDVGDLVNTTAASTGYASSTHGYVAGGINNPPFGTFNIIQKFPFSADANATDIADLLGQISASAPQTN